MSDREKKLLIALLVIALGAGIFLLLDSSPSKNTPPAAQSEAVSAKPLPAFDAQKFPELKERIVAIELSPSQKRVLAQSSIPWERDIFYKDSSKPNHQAQKKKVETKLFSYTGFIQLGEELFAIINNRNYKEGDSLEDWTGYSVGKITKENVVIYTPKKNPLVISYTNIQPFIWEPPQKEGTPQEKQPQQPEPKGDKKDE